MAASAALLTTWPAEAADRHWSPACVGAHWQQACWTSTWNLGELGAPQPAGDRAVLCQVAATDRTVIVQVTLESHSGEA